ncbi:MAG TPA: ribose-5-phosphate isomerase RpiA [Polyangiaceae bacterium]
MDLDAAKRLVAREALKLLPPSGIIGLGTGSTANFFVQALAELVGAGRSLVGVATSTASRDLAIRVGIPLLDEEGPWEIDVCVDGADEVSPTLDVIKGRGGAHTREKIVNRASRTNVIVVDESKLSDRLGENCRVPVEVLRFGHKTTALTLGRYGEPELRLRDGQPFLTDSGQLIYDLTVEPISDPAQLDRELAGIPGVVGTGLFCNCIDVVLVATPVQVRQLRRPT